MSYAEADLPADIVRIPVPTPWSVGPVNVYLLRGEPLTLVDAGPRMPEALSALEDGLATAGVALSDVELLVLTHQHQDHFGHAAEIVRRSWAQVAAFAPLADELQDLPASLARQYGYMARLMARHGMLAAEVQALADRQRRDLRYAESVGVDQLLSGGDTLRAGERTFSVHHRPGHSPSDLVFAGDDGLLIAGDHLLPLVSSNPLAHMPLGARDVDAAAEEHTRPRPLLDYLGSLERTGRMDARCGLPGHGPVFTGIAALVASRVAMHDERADEILRALNREPSTARDLVDFLWDDLPGEMMFLAVSEVIAHLDLLSARGQIRTETIDGVVRNHPATSGRAAA